MPRSESGALVWLCAACLGFWVFLGQSEAAFAGASYQGRWEAREDEAGNLLQLHAQQLGLGLGQFLTERLTSREKVTYNSRWEQEGAVRETLSPGASLSLSGDIFDAGLAVDSIRTRADQSAMGDTDSLGLTWSSRWANRLVPALRANYDYRRRRSDSGGFEVQNNSDSLGGDVNWDLLLAQAFYSYRREQTTNAASESTQESHLATIKARRSWLANRLTVALGHEYSESGNERLVPFPANTVSIEFPLSEVRTGTDPFPDDIDDSMLSSSFTMRDGNTDNSAYLVPAGISSNNSILLVTPPGQQLNNLYLYTQNNLGPAPAGLTWRLYSNDILTTPWNLESPPAVTYDTTKRRFVLVLPPTSAAYLKVVVDLVDLAAPALDFTEVKVEQVLTGTVGSSARFLSEFQTNKSNLAFDYRLSQTAAVSYTFFREQSESGSLTHTDRQSHNVDLRMQNSGGDLKSVLAYALGRHRLQAGPESQTESYRLNVNKEVLPTLALALSGSHEQSSLAGTPSSERDSYSFYADALLYPDLTSRLEVFYWESESYLAKGGSSLGDSFRTYFVLTSRFRPSLTVAISDTYEVQSLGEKATLDQNTTNLNASWQFSEWLALQGSAQRLEGKGVQDAYGYTANVRVGFGAGFELNLGYAFQAAETSSQSGQLKLRSTASKNLTWEIGCDYAESEAGTVQNVYKFYSRLNLQFAAP